MIDSIQNRPLVKVKIKIRISELLKQIRENINYEDGILIIYGKLETVPLPLEITKCKELFDNSFFLRNFKHAFEHDLSDKNIFLHRMFDLDIVIDINSNSQNLCFADVPYFKILVCMCFAVVHNIKLKYCDCYPVSFREFTAHKLGLYKNCFNFHCKELLKEKPTLFDPLLHSNSCEENQAINYLLMMINVYGGNEVNVKIK